MGFITKDGNSFNTINKKKPLIISDETIKKKPNRVRGGGICSSCHNGRMSPFNSHTTQCNYCGVMKSGRKVVGHGGYGS